MRFPRADHVLRQSIELGNVTWWEDDQICVSTVKMIGMALKVGIIRLDMYLCWKTARPQGHWTLSLLAWEDLKEFQTA